MKRTHLAAALAAVLVLSACSTKAGDAGSSGPDSSGVKTGKGVTATDVTLGVMTDKSGVFKNLGLGVTQGNELWARTSTPPAVSAGGR